VRLRTEVCEGRRLLAWKVRLGGPLSYKGVLDDLALALLWRLSAPDPSLGLCSPSTLCGGMFSGDERWHRCKGPLRCRNGETQLPVWKVTMLAAGRVGGIVRSSVPYAAMAAEVNGSPERSSAPR